jgi:hypothetical protein
MHSFYARSSPKRKNSVKSSVSFYAFGTYTSVKAVRRTLMKLTLGVNLINILRAASISTDLESAKRQSSHQCLFALLGPKSCMYNFDEINTWFYNVDISFLKFSEIASETTPQPSKGSSIQPSLRPIKGMPTARFPS